MSRAADLSCPNCGAELAVEQLFGHERDHRAFLHLANLSIPLGARVLQYLQLFAPAKNRLTMARKVRLIEQLLPDLQRQAITHSGRDWEAPLEAWALAIDHMLRARDLGKLHLPLASHAYLYTVIAGMADKVERHDEARRDEERRNRTGGGGTTTLRELLDEFGPELRATQEAIAARGQRERVFHSAADVLDANPHLRKGASQ